MKAFLTDVMGNCCRRRSSDPNPTPSTELTARHRRTRAVKNFRRLVIRVRNLLALRVLWSRCGAWLNVTANRVSNSRHRVASLRSYLSTGPLRGKAILFDHLVRVKGVLKHKNKNKRE